MRARLLQNLHRDGRIVSAGTVVEGDAEWCAQLVARGVAAPCDEAPPVTGFFETNDAFAAAIDEAFATVSDPVPTVEAPPASVAESSTSVVHETKAQRKAREKAEREAAGQ